MNIEITGNEEARLLGILRAKKQARANLQEAMEADNGQAIKHWGEEMRALNEQAGTLLMRAIPDE